jgi:hypothetical protein
MTSITGTIAKIKNNPEPLFSEQTIVNACHDAGYTWRNRIPDPVNTIHLFILQILHGNIACQGLTHLSSLAFTSTAYGQS